MGKKIVYCCCVHATINRRAAEPRIYIGGVVILEDDFTHQLFWKIGHMAALHPAKDRISRAGTLHLSDGSYARYLVQRLVLQCEFPA